MPTTSQDMVIIHRVFRREFGLLPDLILGVDEGDLARAAVVAEHGTLLLDVLHNHHEGEDLLLWPKLRERAPGSRRLFDQMDLDHSSLGAELDTVRGGLDRWRTSAATQNASALAASIADLSPALIAHLDDEERAVLPIVNDLLTQSEWDELGQLAFSQLPPGDALTVLGQMNEDSPAAEWAEFMGHLPEPVQLIYATEGIPAYSQYVGRIRLG